MAHNIIVRRDNFYINEFPLSAAGSKTIRSWFRQNSPTPSYPDYARKFSFDIVPVKSDVKVYLKKCETRLSWDELIQTLPADPDDVS